MSRFKKRKTFLPDVTVLVGSFLVLSLAAFAQSTDLETLYEEARSAQTAGNNTLAIDKYKQIVATHPDLAEAHSNLGTLYFELNDTENTIRSFRAALRLKPTLGAPHFFLGLIAFNARRFQEAYDSFSKAARAEPSNAVTRLYLGYTSYELANYPETVRHLEKSIELEPSNEDASYHLSLAYGQVAKRFFGFLQSEFPDSLQTHLARGHFYEASANWEKARISYERASALAPENERLKRKLKLIGERSAGASVVTVGATPDDLVDGSTRFLSAPPSDVEEIRKTIAKYRSRVAQLKKQKQRSAEQLFFLADDYQVLSYLVSLWLVASAPDSYRVHQIKGQYQEMLGNDEEAIQEYRRAVTLKPDLRGVNFLIGNSYWRRNKLDEALPELQRELRIDASHPNALYEVADIAFAQGRLDEAEDYYNRAIQSDPTMLEAYLGVERVYYSKGQFDKSLNLLEKVVRLVPADPTPHYRMANIYRRLGRTQQAEVEMGLFEKLRAKSETN